MSIYDLDTFILLAALIALLAAAAIAQALYGREL